MNDIKNDLNTNEINYEYLDNLTDDEAIIELDKIVDKNDSVIEQDYLSSFLEQKDRLIYYEVENIYKNPKNKTYRNRLSLKKNPPILLIKDNYENEVNFQLTENLTEELIKTLQEVKRAYYGFNEPSKGISSDKLLDKIKHYAKNNPIKFILPIIVIMMIVTLSIK